MKVVIDYKTMSIDEKGVKEVVRTFKKKGSEIVAIDVPSIVKKSSGVAYKEVSLSFADSQIVTLRVSEKNAVFQAVLNGRVVPIKNQDNLEKAVIELIDMMDSGRKAFVKKLEARKMDVPQKATTSASVLRAELQAKRDGLKDSVENLERELDELKQIEETKSVAAIEPEPVEDQADDETVEPEAIELTGKELGEFPDTEEGKKALLLKAVEHFRGVLEKKDGIFNPALDKWVKFNGTARDKVAQFSKDKRKLLVIAKLDAIVANGKPAPISPIEPHAKAKRKGVVKTHILKTSVNIKGEVLKIRFLIHEMKNGSFFYDHSVDREEVSKVLGGNADARNSADAADLNNSALLQDEPSSQQHFTTNKLPNSLDSVNGSRMVFNLFIEGEEPEYVEDDGEEEAKEIAVELTGFTKLENGSYVSNRAVDYTKLSVGRLNKLLTKDTLTKSDVEDLKDHKFMMLFDKQTAIEKGFLIGVGDNGSYTSKNAHWITNIDHKIKKSGGNPQDLVNNPIALSALAVVSKGDETLSIEQAIERAMSQTNGTIETGDSMVWALSKNSLNKMIAKTNKDGEKPYQAERIKAIQNLKALALAAKEPMIRDDESSDAEVESIYEYMTKFSDDDKVFNLRFLCKKYKKPRKNLKDKMHSMAVMDKAPTSQTDNEISADGQLVDLEISFVQEKLEKGDVIGGADSTMGRSDLSPSVGNRDASIANTPKNTTAQDKNRFADIGYIAGSRKEMAQAQRDLDAQLAIADKLEAEYGYLPAPNGEKSNLNKQQWAQVRTPQFKAWFGDFEQTNQEPVPVTEITGAEITGATPAETRNNAKAYIEELIASLVELNGNSNIHNNRTGFDIGLTKKGVVHGFQHSGAPTVKAVAGIKSLIENAAKIATNPHEPNTPDWKAVHTLVAPLSIGGELFTVKLTAKERPSGEFVLYDHQALEMKKPDGIYAPLSSDGKLGKRPASGNISIKELLSAFNGENTKYLTSKVIDANGEPLVVYHGTTMSDKIKETGFKAGWTHLTDSKVVADSYHEWSKGNSPETLSVYVSSKTPAHYEANENKYTDIGNKVFNATYDAEKKGHDGIIISNIRDNYDSSVQTEPHNTFVAFYPEQIKSAIGNVGTFSKESNKIMDAAQMLNTLDLIEPDLIDEGFEV